jgi:hypothetical protein
MKCYIQDILIGLIIANEILAVGQMISNNSDSASFIYFFSVLELPFSSSHGNDWIVNSNMV